MKPKDLKFPFSWNDRKPALYEGVLIVPQYYEEHTPPEELTLGTDLYVEYCSGNGDWVIKKAKANPHQTWIGVEKDFERVRKIWSKMHNEGVKNLLIVCGEAKTFTEHYLPKESVVEAYVNFPDPWPKDRHAKHRLIQGPFADALAKVMKPKGTITYATDDFPYCEQMVQVMLNHPHWENCFKAPYYEENWKEYGQSWFKNLWETKGRNFYYIQFAKCL